MGWIPSDHKGDIAATLRGFLTLLFLNDEQHSKAGDLQQNGSVDIQLLHRLVTDTWIDEVLEDQDWMMTRRNQSTKEVVCLEHRTIDGDDDGMFDDDDENEEDRTENYEVGNSCAPQRDQNWQLDYDAQNVDVACCVETLPEMMSIHACSRQHMNDCNSAVVGSDASSTVDRQHQTMMDKY